jgi:glycosyltransferase involved in cell wall biosynthesis
MIRRSLHRGDRIIAVSQNTRSDLMKHFDVDGRKIQVVYNGVEDIFRRRLTPEELQRWQRDLGISPPYLLFVGNPAKPHKNLDTVVQAYARARRMAQFDAPLICVGSREGSEFKIRQRAEYLGIGDKVRLLGHVANEALPAIYQGAALFLYPTLYEGFGLPVIEAMASGVAVITSNTSALKELAQKGDQTYATMVDPLDLDGMAKAIATLMGSPERRAAFAERGVVRAEDFRWDQTARRTLEIYLEVIEGRP